MSNRGAPMILDHDDLVTMVKGAIPYYTVFENKTVARAGKYRGGFHDDWSWDTEVLEAMSDKDLLELYQTCVASWQDPAVNHML